MTVGEWLNSLGLEVYLPAFEEHGIDMTVLPMLTADDLKEIGVGAVGQRRLLLNAIAKLADPSNEEPGPERRQTSLLFCEAVESPEAARTADPEERREAIGAFLHMVGDVVASHRGFLAKFMGDGALAYFGYPTTLESKAESAATAALSILSRAEGMSWPNGAPLRARVGIGTGTVVVGEKLGSGVAQEINVVGEAANLAARLQDAAAPGQILICSRTQRQIGDLLDLEALGPRTLKGFDQPVPIWKVRGTGRRMSRFEALRGDRLTGLFGREEALAFLSGWWTRANAGSGGVVTVFGEAGIGKSRLLHELTQTVRADGGVLTSFYCSPDRRGSAFGPVIERLRVAIGTPAQGDAEAWRALIAERLPVPLNEESHAVLCRLLGLPAPRDLLGSYSPQRIRRLTFALLAEFAEAPLQNGPLLVTVEDHHWIDPSTREFLEELSRRAADRPMLMVVTSRPEDMPDWPRGARAATLELGRLPPDLARNLVRETAGESSLAPELIERIVARADGVPLFLEELTRAALGLGLDRADSADADIPDTIRDMLMARIDRLQPIRETIQVASLIGREFRLDLLARALDRPRNEVRAALTKTMGADLVGRRESRTGPVYMFEHALISDAVTETMLKSQRRRYHGRIAEILASGELAAEDAAPERIARHFEAADRPLDAVTWYNTAAHQALERFANQEAADHVGRARVLVDSAPQSLERDRAELAVATLSGAALTMLHGWADERVHAGYERARELWPVAAQASEKVPSAVGLIAYNIISGNLDAAQPLAEELVAMAEASGDAELVMVAEHELGAAILYKGDCQGSLPHFERSVRLYDPERHKGHIALAGKNQAMASLVHLGFAEVLLGKMDTAVRRAEDALAIGRECPHPFTEIWAMVSRLATMAIRHDYEDLARAADEVASWAAEQEFPHVISQTLLFKGWALAKSGRGAEGLCFVRDGIKRWRAMGACRPYYTALAAEAFLAAGELGEARSESDRALEEATTNNERLGGGELFRIHGDILMAAGDRAAAEAAYEKALGMARVDGTRIIALRAAIGLARLRISDGDRAAAEALLRPVLDSFEEALDAHDPRTARDLLEEIRIGA